VVLPFRNQADHIAGVLESWLPALESTGRSFELVAVPNACTDATPEAAREAAGRHPEIRVVENPRGGWGLSVLTGLRAAHGGLLCYANSARTNPGVISPLLDLYLANAPCLAKVARVNRGAPLREAGSAVFNLEARLFFGVRTFDVNGTPKLFPRSLFECLTLESEGDLLDLELLSLVARMGMQVVEHRVEGFSRHGGKSSTNLGTALRMFSGSRVLYRRLNDPRRPGIPVRE
jgi:glycosyltransferase involved in cell wall biosynthesis